MGSSSCSLCFFTFEETGKQAIAAAALSLVSLALSLVALSLPWFLYNPEQTSSTDYQYYLYLVDAGSSSSGAQSPTRCWDENGYHVSVRELPPSPPTA